MIDDRDTTRIVRSWLEVGATSLPDRVLDGVLDQLPATRQRRRSWWSAWRIQQMNSPLKIALATVAVGVLALVAVDLGPRFSGVGGEAVAPPFAMPDEGARLEPGVSYAIDTASFGLPQVIVTPPADGWVSFGSTNIGKGDHNPLVTPWFAGNLMADSCHWSSEGQVDPPIGPTAADLAAGLVEQSGGTASTPTDATVGGYPAVRVELSLPAGLDPRSCEQGQFLRWTEKTWWGGHIWLEGQRNIAYIVDVGDQRVVIDAVYQPGTTESDLAEVEQLIASIRFDSSAVAEPSASVAP